MPIVFLEILELAVGLTLVGQLGSSIPLLSGLFSKEHLATLRRVLRIISVATAVGSALFGLWLFSQNTNLNWLAALRSPWTFIPTAIGLAFLLYRLRGEQPFFYGVIEVLFGAGVIVLTALNPPGDLVQLIVTSAGAVYVIVRGLDNMDRGLSVDFREAWDAVFPKRPKDPQPATDKPQPPKRVRRAGGRTAKAEAEAEAETTPKDA